MLRASRTVLHNEKLLGMLEDLSILARADRQKWRALAFRRAITVLKGSPELKTIEQVEKLPSIGENMKDRLKRFVQTGTFADLDKLMERPGMDAYIRFCRVPYVTKEVAEEAAFDRKFEKIKDLKRLDLSTMQRTYVKNHEDAEKMIPSKEITVLVTKLKSIIHSAVSPDVVVECCGSYRRQLPQSKDIDILITSKENSLKQCVNALAKKKFIVSRAREGDLIFSGFCRLTNGMIKSHGDKLCEADRKELLARDKHPARRIDIHWVHKKAFWPAVVYFTGSKAFNVKMRVHAQSKNLKMSEYGIFSAARKNAKALNVRSERQVFESIGFGYVEPHKRSL